MRLQPALGYVTAALAGLLIGYFAGREHVKYELRSAFQSAAEGFRKDLASLSSDVPAPLSSSLPPSAPRPKDEPAPVEIVLIKKGFEPHDLAASEYEDKITLSLSIKNISGRDIRAVDGDLHITDLLDNEIMPISLAINDPIATGTILKWDGVIRYNQFLERHQRLRGAEQANLKTYFVPKKVLFSDGTIKEYSER